MKIRSNRLMREFVFKKKGAYGELILYDRCGMNGNKAVNIMRCASIRRFSRGPRPVIVFP